MNEYFNTGAQRDEWTELIVVKDNLDLTGWFFGDNNQSTNSWQTKWQFKNHPLWKNLRSGTYIIIDHAGVDTDCDNANDVDKSDGFIRVCSRNSAYFSGGSSTTLFLADGGDFVHLVDPTGKHVHGIGHDDDPGSSVEGGNCVTSSPKWTNTSSAQAGTRPCGNFLYYRFQMIAPQSLYVNAGALADFSAGMQSSESNNYIKVADTPFEGIGNSGGNSAWVVDLRAPEFTAQNVCFNRAADGTISFSWLPSTDPNPSDGTIGYMVLRNLNGDFPAPNSGAEYLVGSTIGAGNQTSTVVKIIANSQISTFSENPGAGNFFYRVFPFRFKNTVGFTHFTRGRTYNISEFVKVNGPGTIQVTTENDTLCAPGIATLRAFASSSASVSWFESATGGQPVATGDSLRLLVNQTKSFWAEVSASALCAIQRYEVKAIIQPIMIDISGPDSVCTGVPAILLAKSLEGIRYEYKLVNPPVGVRDSLSSDSVFYFITVPEYPDHRTITYTIQASNSEGCSSSILTRTISTRVFNPQLKVTPFDPEIGDLVEIELEPSSPFGELSNWQNFGGTFISTSFQKATLKAEDTAMVTVQVCKPRPADGCDCIVQRSMQIKPTVPAPIGVIPNLILTNGEMSVNQTFNFVGYEVRKLEVYDRWGKRVFDASPYNNNWKGDELASGSTCFFIAEVKKNKQANFETVSGWVKLMR